MPTPRIPPHDEDAEQAVLGSLLIDHEIMTIVSGMIKSDYFYNTINKIIFECMNELYEARNPIDILSTSTCSSPNKCNSPQPIVAKFNPPKYSYRVCKSLSISL